MKKFDGMMPPTFVFAAEGKNGDPGPPPSSAIDVGAVAGLAMRLHRGGCVRAYSATPNGSAIASTDAAATPDAHTRAGPPAPNAFHAKGARAAIARMPATTCDRSTHRSSVRLP